MTPLSMSQLLWSDLEFEYERRGTQCLIANLEVATDK